MIAIEQRSLWAADGCRVQAGELDNRWAGARRVLAVRLDNIGDVVMLGPSLRALRRALPQAEVTLMVSPAGAQVAPLLPWINNVIVHRASWQDVGRGQAHVPAQELALVRTLRERQFDAAIIFTSFAQSPYAAAYVCYLAGIPIRAGQSKEFGGAVLTHQVKPLPDEAHQVDRNLFLLQQVGFLVGDAQLELRIPPPVQEAVQGLVTSVALREAGADYGGGYIVLAPGASCAARRYDLGRMAVVARELPRLTGLPVIVVGSDREREVLAPVLARRAAGVVSLVGRTSIAELAALISRAALVITNNSGPMHMTDALGRPMVVLYSGTELESQWRPRSAPTMVLKRQVSCSPCYRFNCPYNLECLDVPVEDVLEAAVHLLGSGPVASFHGEGVGAWRGDQELSHEASNRAN